MREIKFRAWDTKFNSWINPKDVQVNGLGQVFIFQDENLEWYEDRIGQAKILKDTQLKDKNGKEIFEGDIVRGQENMGETYAPFKRFGVVVFKKGCFFYEINAQPHQVLYALLNPEIIGNIYENPELLSPKKSEEV